MIHPKAFPYGTMAVMLGTALFLQSCATPDYTTGKPSVCGVHQVPMDKRVVPIRYGLMRPGEKDAARERAAKLAFPHATEWLGGGCVIERDSPKQVKIYICPSCEDARRQWDREH